VLLGALAERQVGRRDQAASWIWDLASYTREVHEEYAAQRWPETKRLLGLLVNSSGAAHGRNARRLVHQARSHDRRLCAALLAAAVGHTPEANQVLTGARMRLARKPSALARELLRNFPKGRRRRGGRQRRRSGNGAAQPSEAQAAAAEAGAGERQPDEPLADGDAEPDGGAPGRSAGRSEREDGVEESPGPAQQAPAEAQGASAEAQEPPAEAA
jgi:ribonuclease E